MNDSGTNWRLVAYTVGGCWLIPAAMLLLGKQLFLFLNPFPIVVEGIIGIRDLKATQRDADISQRRAELCLFLFQNRCVFS